MDFVILKEFPASDVERIWRDCLARVEFPSHYTAPEYFLVPLWAGKGPFAVLALDGETVTGVLTGLQTGREVICGVASRPQISVDPEKDVNATIDALARGLLTVAGSAELITVHTWSSLELPPFAGYGFRPRRLEGSVVLDLTLGADALFNQFSKDRRRNIRFAEKNGIEVTVATTAEDIAAAYEVYVAWRRTVRKTVQGEINTFEVFQRSAHLTNRIMLMARLSGKAIAINIFRFFPGGLFESAANNSLDEFLHLKPNELLQWRGIEWACQHGLRSHSLGGAHNFLRRFGGTVVPIVRYRRDRTWMRKHDLRETAQDISREALKKMPPPLAKAVRKAFTKDKDKTKDKKEK
ncbi:MAG: GNAT family N-acetyltransferase [Terriglobales bacterium]